jgi:hypothetical protein
MAHPPAGFFSLIGQLTSDELALAYSWVGVSVFSRCSLLPCACRRTFFDARRAEYVRFGLVLLPDSTITNIKYLALSRHGSAARCADDRLCWATAFRSSGAANDLLKCDVFIPHGMEIMLSLRRFESRLLVGAVCLALNGIAWGDGLADGTYGSSMLVAAIAPMAPVEVVPPIPETRQYVFRYAMQYSSYRGAVEALNPSDFYAAPIIANELFKQRATPRLPAYQHPFKPQAQSQAQSSGHALGSVTPSASLINMFELTEDGKDSTVHPHRRLAMMINDWRVSASAHLPLTHPRDAGATVNVQHKF